MMYIYIYIYIIHYVCICMYVCVYVSDVACLDQCGGSSICEHNRRRSECKQCGGASICEHNRQRRKYKQCGGTSICDHNRQTASKLCVTQSQVVSTSHTHTHTHTHTKCIRSVCWIDTWSVQPFMHSLERCLPLTKPLFHQLNRYATN
jgi:hypothetical protein